MANFDDVASEIGIEDGELVWYSHLSQWMPESELVTKNIGLMRVKK